MVRAERDGLELGDAKETIGNIVMTAWKMVHKHPDIRSALPLPLASLSDGLNSFLFSGGSCLAATSCLGCLQCLFVVTWNTCEKSSGPRVTRAKHEGKAHQFITAWCCFYIVGNLMMALHSTSMSVWELRIWQQCLLFLLLLLWSLWLMLD